MRVKSTGVKLLATNTVLSVPAGKYLKISSLYVSNIDSNDQSASVFVTKPSTGDFYIVKDALVPKQATLQVISNVIILTEGDELKIDTSSANKLDCFVSYEELFQYD